MKLTRPLLAVVLSSSLVLAACSDDDEQPTSTDAGASTSAAPADDDATTATGAPDDASATATASPTDADSATATSAPGEEDDEDGEQAIHGGVVTIEEADQIAADLLTKAEQARFASGSERQELVLAAYNGPARIAARAEGRLRSVTGAPEGEPAEVEPTVLAISRAEEGTAKYIVAQTVPEDGVPRLHLMATGGTPDLFRIIWEGDMLPGTSVGQFERRSLGSPVIGPETESDLYFKPEAVQRLLGRVLDYPIMDAQPNLRTSGYAPEVREQARSQAAAVEEQATFRQTHQVRGQNLITIELADGSALTFGVLDRRSDFQVRDGMELTPPETFRAFVNDAAITDSARVNWLVFTAVQIGTDNSPPGLIAVGEQVVGAEGS
jgi:hypothetical protein